MAKGGGAGTRTRAAGETHARPAAAAPAGPRYTGHEALTPAQADAVRTYQGAAYDPINRYYRGLSDTLSDYYARLVPHLDAAIAGSRINRDITLYRGMKMYGGLAGKIRPGQTIEDPAFFSAGRSARTAQVQAGLGEGIILKLRVPAGARGLNVKEAGRQVPEYRKEREVLLPRGTKYRVLSSRQTTIHGKKRTIVEAELVR